MNVELGLWLLALSCPLGPAFLRLQNSPGSGLGPLCSASSHVWKLGYWSQLSQEAAVTLGGSNASSFPSLCAVGGVGVRGDLSGLHSSKRPHNFAAVTKGAAIRFYG